MSKPFGFVGLLSDYLLNIRLTMNLGQEKVLHKNILYASNFLGSLKKYYRTRGSSLSEHFCHSRPVSTLLLTVKVI